MPNNHYCFTGNLAYCMACNKWGSRDSSVSIGTGCKAEELEIDSRYGQEFLLLCLTSKACCGTHKSPSPWVPEGKAVGVWTSPLISVSSQCPLCPPICALRSEAEHESFIRSGAATYAGAWSRFRVPLIQWGAQMHRGESLGLWSVAAPQSIRLIEHSFI
jgi:hypothetical protein